ncbi:MAG TPA: SLC13 family permease [Vicinamibacteria bacterium]
MNPALASLAALLLAIALSFSSRLNVGLPALALAWLIGVFTPGAKPEALAAAFPASLFLTLLGVSLLFALAEANGTLVHLAEDATRLVGGDLRSVPWMLFLVAAAVSAIGPGAISSVALMAPLAAPIARRLGLPAFLTSLMVVNGANAANLSPLSAVGIIANSRMAEAGLGGHEAKVFAANFLAHLAVTLGAFAFWLWKDKAEAAARRSSGSPNEGPAPATPNGATKGLPRSGFERCHALTLAVIALWMVSVIVWRLPVGYTALVAVVLLLALRAGDEAAVLPRVPWAVLVMVCGMATLVSFVEKAGGLDLMSALIARLSTPATVHGVVAFVTGVISTWSSTSGVVLPAFLPTVPSLVARLGGGDPLAVALSINVGSSLVDVSPLSTLGALCISALADPSTARHLFRQLMAWGLSMSVVGALLCQLFAGPLARL